METNKEKMEKLIYYNELDQVVSFSKAKSYYDTMCRQNKVISSGFVGLNRLINGFEPQELITISGLTSDGKTTLGQTLTKNFSKNKVPVLWFTYEVQANKFLAKFTHLPEKGYLPLKNSENTLSWIEDRILEGIAKYGVEVVFIDHLHYIVPLSKNVNMSLVIGDVMRKLKTLAVTLNITIFIIAHLQKVNIDIQPDLEHIRDSSFIAQESDTVLIIWRKAEIKGKGRDVEITYLDEATLKVAKCRSTGNKGTINLKHQNKLFYELSGEDLSKDGLTYCPE